MSGAPVRGVWGDCTKLVRSSQGHPPAECKVNRWRSLQISQCRIVTHEWAVPVRWVAFLCFSLDLGLPGPNQDTAWAPMRLSNLTRNRSDRDESGSLIHASSIAAKLPCHRQMARSGGSVLD